MICPNCGSERTEIIETRASGENERRRRRCRECRCRFTTYEITKKAYNRLLEEEKTLEAIAQGVKQVAKARKDNEQAENVRND
jgi:transcriptional regulator NrdR family protein